MRYQWIVQSLPEDLAVDLAALWLDRHAYHHDLCSGDFPCDFAGLVTSLVDLLLPGFTDTAARLGLEGKPFCPEEHPGLLPQRATQAA